MRFGAGPLTAAATAVVDVVPADHAHGDPAAFFARLLDLRGSVDLARGLATAERARPAMVPRPVAPIHLRALTEERLAGVRADIDRVFSDPFQRRNKLPSAVEVYAALERAGALVDRQGRALGAAAEVVWPPFGDLVIRVIERVRFEVDALRTEIGPALADAGPAAAGLEQLDAALFGATAKGRRQIEDRLLPALTRSFGSRLRAAVAALPEPATAAHLAPWFAPRGWMRAEILHGRRVAEAVLSHEQRRIEALVEAA
jgi:hypothetical protein